VDVVVFDENKLVAELRVAHHLRDLLEHAFARLIERMRFAGKNKLDGALRVVDHRCEAFDVGENQIGALVCGEAARKADRERVGAEYVAETNALFRRFTAAFGLFHCATAYKFEQSSFEVEMRLPKFAIVNVVDTLPDFCFGAMLLPTGPEMTVV